MSMSSALESISRHGGVRVAPLRLGCKAPVSVLTPQSPPKGATIPYRPSPSPAAVLIAGNQVSLQVLL